MLDVNHRCCAKDNLFDKETDAGSEVHLVQSWNLDHEHHDWSEDGHASDCTIELMGDGRKVHKYTENRIEYFC